MTSSEQRGLQNLENRTVVITGGSSGIGLATAQEVITLGGIPVIVGRSAEKLRKACTVLGPSAKSIQLDVTDEMAVKQAFDGVGRIDHLVTAAAGTLRGRQADLDTNLARNLFEGKFWGQYYCAKYATPHMPADGSMVLFSGWISRKPMVEMSTLAAVDGAIESLARSLAIELGPIRVNAITPGQIDTPLWRSRLSEQAAREHFERVAKAHPVGRAGTADDIAAAVLFLLRNGFMSGAVLDIDGGWH